MDLKVVKRRKDYIEAHIVETKKYDPHFADGEIFCPHYFIPRGISEVNAGTAKIGCGGCKWQIMSYPRQLELKQGLVEESFKKVTKTHPISFLPIIGSPLPQGYRNKIEFSFGVYIQQSEEYRRLHKQGISDEEIEKQGIEKYVLKSEKNCGFHKQGEFSKIVDVDSCGLISSKANQIFEKVKGLCFVSGLAVYDQKTHQGFFRHLVLREGVNTGQMMVNLSVSLSNLQGEETKLWEKLLEQFKADSLLKQEVSTFIITYNDGLADTVKNDKSEAKTFWGDGYIHETLSF